MKPALAELAVDAPPARQTDPVLAIAGPTASGKTALALAFARQWAAQGSPVEIISVDSALVYRGMDIGTAKPSAAERAEVPHHLIDLIDPAQSYSAARFVQDACALVRGIRARGHLPLLVGGTMLYFKALQHGLDEMPPANPAVRAAIDARAALQGWPALHAELARVDPVTAARLPVHDAQRIQRALEVWQTSGQPLSAWQQGGSGSLGNTDDMGDSGPSAPGRGPRLPLQLLALEPVQRAWLHQRIAERFDAMLQAGLLAEVAALRTRADLHPGLPSMRCVGYRQAWAALAAGLPVNAEAQALVPLREQGIAATRQLAKRQLTWLRSMPARDVLACDHPDALQSGIHRLLVLARSLHPR